MHHCKKEHNCKLEDFPLHFEFPYTIDKCFKPVGCNKCYHTGYKGRTAIYEVVRIDNKTANAIKNNTITELFENNKEYKSLSDKAFDIFASGETSLEEIYSILIHI